MSEQERVEAFIEAINDFRSFVNNHKHVLNDDIIQFTMKERLFYLGKAIDRVKNGVPSE